MQYDNEIPLVKRAGKSTAMRAVREARQATGGRVLGFAPSAVAASVLGVDLDIQPGDMLLCPNPEN